MAAMAFTLIVLLSVAVIVDQSRRAKQPAADLQSVE
jgi:hypothetical protein